MPVLIFLTLVLCWLSAGCVSIPEYPVRADFIGTAVDTTVDSPLAREFLNNNFSADMISLKEKYDALPLTQETMASLSGESSTDFAAVYFSRRIAGSSHHKVIADAFHRRFSALKAGAPEQKADARADDVILLFVPGFQYEMTPESGADFLRPRRLLAALGYEGRLVPAEEEGTIARNAGIVAETIRRESASGKKVIIVSTSKSGLEVAVALGSLLSHDEQQHVGAWFSLGGLLRGTRLADMADGWLSGWLTRSWFWWHGMSARALSGMKEELRRPAFAKLRFRPDLLMIQYIAVPLSGQASHSKRYRLLYPGGPNDGLTYVADELIDGGYAVIAPGLDHFYRHPDIDLVTRAFIDVMIARLFPAS